MKKVILYKSALGATRQYAGWLQEIMDADVFSYQEAKEIDLSQYDLVVVSSGTYVGKMPLTKFLIKNWEILKDKKVVAVAVGMAPPDVSWSQRSYKMIPEEIRQKIKYFKLPGKGGEIREIKEENLQPVLDYLKKI